VLQQFYLSTHPLSSRFLFVVEQAALTDNGKPEACISNTTTKLLDLKACAKLPPFESKVLKVRSLHHYEFLEALEAGRENPVVARVRTQWLAPQTDILWSTVNEYLEKNHSVRYKTGTTEVASCQSANSPRAKPTFKRARATLEPSATEEALARAAKAVVTGQVLAFGQAVPTMLVLPLGFSEEDRLEILAGKPRWAAKHVARLPPIPKSVAIELKRLHSLAGHHVSAAKVHTDLMRDAGWVTRCCVDVARIKQFFSTQTNKKKKKAAPDDGNDAEDEKNDDEADTADTRSAMNEAMDEAEKEMEEEEEEEEEQS